MSVTWPEHAVDLAEAARLFERAGKPVHRSSLSRFINDPQKNFPHTIGPKGAKLVDAKALWDAYTTNFTRQVMAGETGSVARTYTLANSPAPGQIPGAAPAGDTADADPKLRIAQINAMEKELDLAERLNQTAPVAEVTAAGGEAMANLRAAQAEARADTVSRLLQLFGRPESDARLVRDVLKQHDRLGQDKFAEVLAAFLTPEGQKCAPALEKLARAEKIAEALDADTPS